MIILKLLVAFTLFILALSKSILIIYDDQINSIENFDKLIKLLDSKSYDITLRSTSNSLPASFSFNEKKYDNLLYLSTLNDELTSDLSSLALVEQLNQQGNLIICSDEDISSHFRNFAREFSIEIDDQKLYQFDKNNLISVDKKYFNYPFNNVECNNQPLLYDGHSHHYPITQPNDLRFPIINAPPGSFNSDTDFTSVEYGKGEYNKLVTALQTTKNSRVVWVGSVKLFDDENLNENSCNEAFISKLIDWTYQSSDVLNVTSINHSKIHKDGQEEQKPLEYVYNDTSKFEIGISVKQGDNWQPFITNDLQLEFTMLDPYIRTTLTPSRLSEDGKSMIYTKVFTIPDRHGIFKFVINYKRHGLSYIDEQIRTTVVPVRHDEHPRFLNYALPFYTGSISTIVGFVIFSIIWINWNEKIEKKKE